MMSDDNPTPEEDYEPQHRAPKSPFSNRTYDVLKFIAQIALPALGTFYALLGGIWGFPRTEEVVGTIVGFDLFLGALLGLSSKAYDKSDEKYDGELNVLDNGEGQMPGLLTELNETPDKLARKKEVVFRIKQQ